MTNPSRAQTLDALLKKHGRTFGDELGVDVAKDTPSPLFRLLTFSLLASTRISHDAAMSAAKALAREGWTTAEKMQDSTWRQRTDVLNRAGYARYDESTARMLGDTADLLMNRYRGDLRRLRQEARQDPDDEKKRLKECKGIGEVGAAIFMREAQAAWEELYPFADKSALQAAKRLDLGDDAQSLARRVKQSDFPRLVAALVRTRLTDDYDAVRRAAA